MNPPRIVPMRQQEETERVKDKRTYKLQVRLSPAELDRLDALCAETGLSRADQARYSTLGADAADALAHGRELAAILAQLGKIGSNLNQAVHVANATGQLDQIGQLEDLAAVVDRTRRAIRR